MPQKDDMIWLFTSPTTHAYIHNVFSVPSSVDSSIISCPFCVERQKGALSLRLVCLCGVTTENCFIPFMVFTHNFSPSDDYNEQDDWIDTRANKERAKKIARVWYWYKPSIKIRWAVANKQWNFKRINTISTSHFVSGVACTVQHSIHLVSNRIFEMEEFHDLIIRKQEMSVESKKSVINDALRLAASFCTQAAADVAIAIKYRVSGFPLNA